MCLVHQDKGWSMLITFVRMVKFKFLAHLPMDHLAHPVEFSLIFILC